MAEIVMLVCDVDLKPGEVVRHYTVTVDGHTMEMDLCDRHAGVFAPVSPVEASERKPVQSLTPARGRTAAQPRATASSRRKVTTLAEIEASKR